MFFDSSKPNSENTSNCKSVDLNPVGYIGTNDTKQTYIVCSFLLRTLDRDMLFTMTHTTYLHLLQLHMLICPILTFH